MEINFISFDNNTCIRAINAFGISNAFKINVKFKKLTLISLVILSKNQFYW